MADLSALSTLTATASTLSNLILVTPNTIGYQPQNASNSDGTPSTAAQPPSFVFDYEGEQSVTLESDITDHFVEDNTALQDQIALKPVLFSTHGFIGELNDVTPAVLKTVKTATDKLVLLGAYTPSLSVSALVAYNTAFQLYQTGITVANSAVSAWTSITGGATGESVISGSITNPIQAVSNQNKQQVAFQRFYGYWAARQLFTVQTPWAVFQNMALKSIRAIQDPDTNVITDFEISFKQIRMAVTTLSALPGGRLSTQSSTVTDLGTSTPPASIDLSSALSSNFPGALTA